MDEVLRRYRFALIACVVAWCVTAVVLWATSPLLGDNEALYARSALLELRGLTPPWHYLSRGMTWVAMPGVLAGGSERALRVIPLLLGFGFVAAAGMFARQVRDWRLAALTLGALAGTSAIAKRSCDLLGDLPAAACLLAGLAIVVGEISRPDGPSRRLLWVAPCFAGALYLRYGSVLPIAIIVVVVALFAWRTLVLQPRRVLGAGLLFLLLMVPHAVQATIEMGSPLGFLLEGNHVLRVAYRGEGLVGFVANNPFHYYGWITTPLMVIGIASIVRPRDRRMVMLWMIAVLTIVAIGLTTVAESRYLMLSMTILVTLGVDAVTRAIELLSPAPRRVCAYLGIALVVASWFSVFNASLHVAQKRKVSFRSMVALAQYVKADAAGAPCKVVTRHTSQVEWYSGCSAMLDVPALGGDRVYVARDDFGDFQVSTENLPGHVQTVHQDDHVLVLRLDP